MNRIEERSQGLELKDYLRVFHMYWRRITAITLLVTLLALGWTLLQKPVYEAESSGIVSAGTGGGDIAAALQADNLAKSKAKSYSSVAKSRPVAEAVIRNLNLATTADELMSNITVEIPLDTSELRVSATAGQPAAARDLADAWVIALAGQVHDLESAGITEQKELPDPVVRIIPLAEAELPAFPVSPNTKLILVIGAIVGLTLGLAHALLRNHLDRRIRSAEQLEKTFGVPVIGTIPRDKRLVGIRKVVETGTVDTAEGRVTHGMSESLRELRTNLTFVDVDNPPRIIVVTSSVPGEGKSSVVSNLAVTIAASGQRVVVVDGDLRKPVIVNMFGMVPGAGVTDVLSGKAELEDLLQVWGPAPSLAVLGSGRIPPNPSELLSSRAMAAMLQELAEHAVVLIDAPPLLPVTDAAVLAKTADGAIVVVSAGKTTTDELDKALRNLKRVDARILGVILNRVPTQGADASQYGYYGLLSTGR